MCDFDFEDGYLKLGLCLSGLELVRKAQTCQFMFLKYIYCMYIYEYTNYLLLGVCNEMLVGVLRNDC